MTKKKIELQKMLPSKKFVKTMVLCVGACAVLLVIASYVGGRSAFSKPKVVVGKDATVSDLMTQDSNDNGIPDWEESLYGLDPKGDGVSNKSIIDAKKLKAQQDNGITDGGTPDDQLTDTAKLARETLSTILALQQSGNLTPEAISNLADTLGEHVDSKRDDAPAYTLDNITVVDDSNTAMIAYEKGFKKALDRAKSNNIGGEMNVVYQGLDPATGKDNLAQLSAYVSAYDQLAKDILVLKAPQSLAQRSLALANAAELMSHALAKIQMMYSDAATGLVGFDEFTTANGAMADSVSDLVSGFSTNSTN